MIPYQYVPCEKKANKILLLLIIPLSALTVNSCSSSSDSCKPISFSTPSIIGESEITSYTEPGALDEADRYLNLQKNIYSGPMLEAIVKISDLQDAKKCDWGYELTYDL
jgi:hypothetical protein